MNAILKPAIDAIRGCDFCKTEVLLNEGRALPGISVIDGWKISSLEILAELKRLDHEMRLVEKSHALLEKMCHLVQQLQGVPAIADIVKLELLMCGTTVMLTNFHRIRASCKHEEASIPLNCDKTNLQLVKLFTRVQMLFGATVSECASSDLSEENLSFSFLSHICAVVVSQFDWFQKDLALSINLASFVIDVILNLILQEKLASAEGLIFKVRAAVTIIDGRVSNNGEATCKTEPSFCHRSIDELSTDLDLVELFYHVYTKSDPPDDLLRVGSRKCAISAFLCGLHLFQKAMYGKCAAHFEDCLFSSECEGLLSTQLRAPATNILGICLAKESKLHSAKLIFADLDVCEDLKVPMLMNFAYCLLKLKDDDGCLRILSRNLRELDFRSVSSQKVKTDGEPMSRTEPSSTNFGSLLSWFLTANLSRVWEDVDFDVWPLILSAQTINRLDVLIFMTDIFVNACRYSEAADACLDFIYCVERGACEKPLLRHQTWSLPLVYRTCCFCLIKSRRGHAALTIGKKLERTWPEQSPALVREISAALYRRSMLMTLFLESNELKSISCMSLGHHASCTCWLSPYLAEALMQDQQFEAARELLQKAAHVSLLEERNEEPLARDAEEPLNGPVSKKRKFSDEESKVKRMFHYEKFHIHNNLAVVMLKLGMNQDAFSLLKMAVKSCQSQDALFPELGYNYCRWLATNKTVELANLNWAAFHASTLDCDANCQTFASDYKTVFV